MPPARFDEDDDSLVSANCSGGLPLGVVSRKKATLRDQLAAGIHRTRGPLAVRIGSRPGVWLHLAVRIGSGPVLGPGLRLAIRIGSRAGLNPQWRVSASGRGSCVAKGAGPPSGQRVPELGQRLPGALQGETSWEPRRRRRGKGWRRRQKCSEDDHDGNEAAMRPGHRGLSFSQGRPNVAASMAGVAPPRTKGALRGR